MATDGNMNMNELVTVKPAKAAPAEVESAAPVAPVLELEAVREQLAGAKGVQYWRSLEELSNKEGFDQMLEREFPRQASEWLDPVSRRGFLKLMSASLALAGLSACTKQPEEAIVPYVQQPEDLIPGKPLFFATARPTPFGAQPLLVKSQMYRPVKIEGNPDHAMSKGACDTYTQGSLLDLYDPDRMQAISKVGGTRTWGEFVGEMRDAAAAEKAKQGSGMRFLTETNISPTFADQMQGVLKLYPQAKWYQYDPVNRDNARAGSRMAFGQYVEAQYQLAAADVIVSLDADFLYPHFPGFLKLASDFATRRKPEENNPEMNRLYVVESQMSTTGSKADNRLPMRASDVEQFASALAAAVGAGGGGTVSNEAAKKFLDVVANDLKANRGKCVVIPGENQSPAVHALAASMNSALGAVGKTVVYTDTVETNSTEQGAGLKELVADMNAGKVSLLITLGGNPVFNAPADLSFEAAYTKVPLRAHVSTHMDETSRLSHWNVPSTHYLESWSDARAYDGTISIVQPLIEPLYNGHNPHEVLTIFSDSPGITPFETVQNYWKAQRKLSGAEFEAWWKRTLHDGFIANTAFAPKTVSAKSAAASTAQNNPAMEIVFRPDPTIFDGRFINNGWLQEIPKPVTKLTWDNAAIMSPVTAGKLGYEDQSVATITLGGRKVDAPIKMVPGHPDNSITVYLGYGRTHTGRVGSDTGFNAYKLRTLANSGYAVGATLERVAGKKWALAVTQHHHLVEQGKPKAGQSTTGDAAASRQIIRAATLEEFRKNPEFAVEGANEPVSKDITLYPNWTEDPTKTGAHQWGMAIDMNSCIGCNACVIACVAENNIAVVGKDQVLAGREMHWIRIDTYFESKGPADVANPRAYFQPVPCMQCENAPCEPVCPVGATVHSPEGLNDMVYNRCVGTRYCSNNCPYKVRRFNFLLYSDWDTQSYYPMRNPDVTVRSRGVMEKCTYCVQRINSAKIDAEKRLGKPDANGQPHDGKVHEEDHVQTACQQTCPTGAIVFGNVWDPNSRVSQIKKQSRNYALLAELNTRPRTTYIATVRNPNAELEETKQTETHG
ncbi:MAG: Molybdopterin oxidoreductase, iron-sulfur binding subunit [Acidobacteriales bacterium]|nr:Molybdopterin oxidoreductase, iron-sulfur binding subunit [Terriglobales bacterium]